MTMHWVWAWVWGDGGWITTGRKGWTNFQVVVDRYKNLHIIPFSRPEGALSTHPILPKNGSHLLSIQFAWVDMALSIKYKLTDWVGNEQEGFRNQIVCTMLILDLLGPKKSIAQHLTEIHALLIEIWHIKSFWGNFSNPFVSDFCHCFRTILHLVKKF